MRESKLTNLRSQFLKEFEILEILFGIDKIQNKNDLKDYGTINISVKFGGLQRILKHQLTVREQVELLELQSAIGKLHSSLILFFQSISKLRSAHKCSDQEKVKVWQDLKKHYARILSLFRSSFVVNNNLLQQLEEVKKNKTHLQGKFLSGARKKTIVRLNNEHAIEELDENSFLNDDTIYLQEIKGKMIASWHEREDDFLSMTNKIRKHEIIDNQHADICRSLLQSGECITKNNGEEKLKIYEVKEVGLIYTDKPGEVKNPRRKKNKEEDEEYVSRFDTIAASCGYSLAMWVQGYQYFCQRIQQYQQNILIVVNDLISYANYHFPIELDPLIIEHYSSLKEDQLENKEEEIKKRDVQETQAASSPFEIKEKTVTGNKQQAQTVAKSPPVMTKLPYIPCVFNPYFQGIAKQPLFGLEQLDSTKRINYIRNSHPGKAIATFFNHSLKSKNQEAFRKHEQTGIIDVLPFYDSRLNLFFSQQLSHDSNLKSAYSIEEARILFYGIFYNFFWMALQEGKRVLDLSLCYYKGQANIIIQQCIRDVAALPEFCGQFEAIYTRASQYSNMAATEVTILNQSQTFQIHQLIATAQNFNFHSTINQRAHLFAECNQEIQKTGQIKNGNLEKIPLLPAEYEILHKKIFKLLIDKMSNKKLISITKKKINQALILINRKKETNLQWVLSIELIQLTIRYIDNPQNSSDLDKMISRCRTSYALTDAAMLDQISFRDQKKQPPQQQAFFEKKNDKKVLEIDGKIKKLKTKILQKTDQGMKKCLTEIINYSKQLSGEFYLSHSDYPINGTKIKIVSRFLSLLSDVDFSQNTLLAIHKFFKDCCRITHGVGLLTALQELIGKIENFGQFEKIITIFPKYKEILETNSNVKQQQREFKWSELFNNFFERKTLNPEVTKKKNLIIASLEKDKAIFDCKLNVKHMTAQLEIKLANVKTLLERKDIQSTLESFTYIKSFLSQQKVMESCELPSHTVDDSLAVSQFPLAYHYNFLSHLKDNPLFTTEYYLKIQFLIRQLETYLLTLVEQNLSKSGKAVSKLKLLIAEYVLEYYSTQFKFVTHSHYKNSLDQLNKVLLNIVAAKNIAEINQIIVTKMDLAISTYLKAKISLEQFNEEVKVNSSSNADESVSKSSNLDSSPGLLEEAKNDSEFQQQNFDSAKKNLDLCCQMIQPALSSESTEEKKQKLVDSSHSGLGEEVDQNFGNFENLINSIPDSYEGRTFAFLLLDKLKSNLDGTLLLKRLSENCEEKSCRQQAVTRLLTFAATASNDCKQLEIYITMIENDSGLKELYKDFVTSTRCIVTEFKKLEESNAPFEYFQSNLKDNPRYLKLLANC